MKIAVECKSPLLQKSLELFLSRYLCSSKHCDILVRDEPFKDEQRCFFISASFDADLVKPFSKSQLILALEYKYKSMSKTEVDLDFNTLEQRISCLTKEYEQNILTAVKAFYEK